MLVEIKALLERTHKKMKLKNNEGFEKRQRK